MLIAAGASIFTTKRLNKEKLTYRKGVMNTQLEFVWVVLYRSLEKKCLMQKQTKFLI